MTLDPGQELPLSNRDVEAIHRYAFTHLSSICASYLLGQISREAFARAVADIEVQVQADLNRITLQCYQHGVEAGRHRLNEDRKAAPAVAAPAGGGR